MKRLVHIAAIVLLLLGVVLAERALAQEHGEHGAAPSAEHAEHAEHGGHDMTLNVTDPWNKEKPAIVSLVINFGILMIGYYVLGKKPIAEALKQRRVTIGKAIEDAQSMLGEAKERAKKYQADLKNVDTDAADAKAALIAGGKGEVERMLTDAQEKAERMKRDADRLVEQERKQLHHDLVVETVDLAVKEAAKTLEKSVTAEDHARLAEDLLKELAAAPAAKSGAHA